MDQNPASVAQLLGKKFRHYKNGKEYRLLAKAKHTETQEMLAIYLANYPPFETFARPWDMFFGEVDGVKRFEQVP